MRLKGAFVDKNVVVEAWGREVEVFHFVGEKVIRTCIFETLVIWSVDPFHFFVIDSFGLFANVDSTKEPGIEAHLVEKSSIGV